MSQEQYLPTHLLRICATCRSSAKTAVVFCAHTVTATNKLLFSAIFKMWKEKSSSHRGRFLRLLANCAVERNHELENFSLLNCCKFSIECE